MSQSREAAWTESGHSPLGTVVAWGVAAIFVVGFVAWVAVPAAGRQTNGFSAYYTAARLAASGQATVWMYDDAWFSAETMRLGFARAPDVFNTSPSAALLLLPLASLAPAEAKAVWTGLNLIFLALAVAGLARVARLDAPTAALGVIVVTLYQPVHEQMSLGQGYALLLVLEVAFAWAMVARREKWAGLALGLMLGLKTAGLALPGLLVARRRWRALIWLLAAVVAVIGLSLLWVEPATWRTYVGLLLQPGAHPEFAISAYQSLPGLWLHLFRAEPTWNPRPAVDAPALALALTAVSALALVGGTFWLTWKATASAGHRDADDVGGEGLAVRSDLGARASCPRESPGTRAGRMPAPPEEALPALTHQPHRLDPMVAALAAWATLAVVLDPGALDYHYVLLLAPIALALAWCRDERLGWRAWLALGLVVFLVGAPLPYKSPRLSAGLWALLAYPKLYGGLLLWGLAALRLTSSLPTRAPG